MNGFDLATGSPTIGYLFMSGPVSHKPLPSYIWPAYFWGNQKVGGLLEKLGQQVLK